MCVARMEWMCIVEVVFLFTRQKRFMPTKIHPANVAEGAGSSEHVIMIKSLLFHRAGAREWLKWAWFFLQILACVVYTKWRTKLYTFLVSSHGNVLHINNTHETNWKTISIVHIPDSMNVHKDVIHNSEHSLLKHTFELS